MKVYDYPQYYELAFSHRDIPAEVEFIQEALRRYSLIPVSTVLELGSGNSPHMQELCRRGYAYMGLEINEKMVAYSRDKIARSHLTAATVYEGDMVDFDVSGKADCVLVLLCSLYVKTDEEFDRHLKAVARNLRSGGLYILDGVVSHTTSATIP